jgi:anti-anti-sigma factor
MQQSGLEWLYRLLQEPRRLFWRYAMDMAVFGSFFLRQWWTMRTQGSHGQCPSVDLEIIQENAILNLRGCFTKDTLDVFYPVEQEALNTSACILVNLAQVEFLDSSAIGQLIELGNQARVNGGQLSLAGIPNHILRRLRLLKLENLFPIYPSVDAYLSAGETKTSMITVARQIPSPVDGRVWTVLNGPRVLDASTSQDLLEAGISLLERCLFVICDLTETMYLTSAGLAALARLRQKSLDLHGEFRVVLRSEDVLRAIKLEHIDQILPLYNDFSQAVSSHFFS